MHDVHRGGGAAPTAHLEYFGTLKTICKAEERRKLRKKQRRFVQYLVKFGLDADEIAAFAEKAQPAVVEYLRGELGDDAEWIDRLQSAVADATQ